MQTILHIDLKKNYPQHIGGTPINDEMNALITEEKQNTRRLHGDEIEKKLNEIFQ